MGAALHAELDIAGLQRTLTALASIKQNPTPLLRAIGTGLAANTRDRFPRQQDPWGRAWRPLQPAYAELKRGSGILVESGQLQASITFATAGMTVSVGSNKVYAGVHQFGATIRPKNARALVFRLAGPAGTRSVHAASVTIPARPYLGIGPEDVETIMDATEAVLAWAVKAGA